MDIGCENLANTSVGHGLRAVSPEILTHRREASRELLRVLEDGVDPARLPVLQVAVKLMMDIIYGIERQTSADWFLTSAMLGHPTPPSARKMAANLANVAFGIERRKAEDIEWFLGALRKAELPARLQRFIACTRHENPVPSSVEADWLYVLRSNEEWGVLNLGTISGHLEDAVAEMDEINPELAPYGVTAAWQVRDAGLAYDTAANLLKHAFVQTDFYEFDQWSEVKIMKELVTEYLRKEKQLVTEMPRLPSSWHPRAAGRRHVVASSETEEQLDIASGPAP
tara:strand:+ start:5780 stop:6628 length:849 start_codon:yes stop_codon:yes gene_type:complete